MDIAVSPVDPADEATAVALFEIANAALRHDAPEYPPFCRYNFLGGFAHPWPGAMREWVVARAGGAPVGYAHLAFPQLDNTENMTVEPFVAPAHRRRGVGRALHAHALERARANGRKNLVADTVAALPGGPPRDLAGAAFAEAMGATAAHTEVRRRLDLDTVDEALLDGLLADARARAAGYSVVQWSGPTPQEYIDDVAYLDGRLVADAPMGDLEWEPEKVDAARVRATERALAARQRRNYHTGARHDASGRLVAWTTLGFNRSYDRHAWQQITIVDPEHRGHRLGMLVKIENLRYTRAAEPQLRVVDTTNAVDNAHMISINEAMGFRPADAWTSWQLKL